jgi:Tol biopolymer transport system component
MGEVYRARDLRLNRDVALKVLREEGAADATRLARFRRETQAVAALNHPGILAIYDTGMHGGSPYAVMELLDGETLADRIGAGALPAREASEIAARVADALAAAHAHGIVHRDVKPANIFLTRDGQTKLLDFGIARDAAAAAGGTTSETLDAPTQGLVGTASYVSPEQVRGQAADGRSDVFALGAVLFESLSGRKAFAGATVAETLVAVMSDDPGARPETDRLPPDLRRIALRCLEKDPANRYQSARDLALDLRGWESATRAAPAEGGRPSPVRRLLTVAAAGALLAAGFLLAGRIRSSRRLPPAAPIVRVPLALAPPISRTSAERPLFALSPDGARIVYVSDREGRTGLTLREAEGLETRSLTGTEDATGPFFSPDGRWIGFFGASQLEKLPLSGGAPSALRRVPPVTRGAAWGPDDTIVFAPVNTGGLLRLSASTGEEARLLWPDYDAGEQAYRWPAMLPGGKALLFTIYAGGDSFDAASIAAVRLDGTGKRVLVRGGTSPRYAPSGHLVYARGGTLLAATFDAERLEVTGPAAPVLSGVRTEGTGAAQYAFSADGTLLYLPGPSPNRAGLAVVRVDRAGNARAITTEPAAYYGVRFSPDGRRLTYSKGDANQDVWIRELDRGTETRLTPEASEEFDPVWSPDGKRIAYSSERRAEDPRVFVRAADGSGEESFLWKGGDAVMPQSWAPDGSAVALAVLGEGKQWDIWILDPGKAAARPFLATPQEEVQPDFSPDLRWVAYVSDESGRFEVYARAYPGPGPKIQVSADGGMEPVWSRDGKELFFRDGDRLMSAPVRPGPDLSFAKASVVFEKPGLLSLPFTEFRQYDVAPDGKSFVMIQLPEANAPPAVPVLVTNWFAEVGRKLGEADRR